MVPTPDTHSTPAAPAAEETGNTVINGLLGGFAGILLSFIPFATILGGMIAGYLEGGTPTDGIKPGLIAGLVMLLPVSVLLFFVVFVLGFGGMPAAFGILGVAIVLFTALYTVGSGVLGGYLGVYVKNTL